MKIVLKNFLTFNYFYNNFFLTALMLLISKNQFQKQHKISTSDLIRITNIDTSSKYS